MVFWGFSVDKDDNVKEDEDKDDVTPNVDNVLFHVDVSDPDVLTVVVVVAPS